MNAAPTTTVAAEALLVTAREGRPPTVTITVLLRQGVATGQAVSPPPLTVAVLLVLPVAAAVAVTRMVRVTVSAGASEAIVQDTTCWFCVQPLGSDAATIVSPVGIESLTCTGAVVASAPVLLTSMT